MTKASKPAPVDISKVQDAIVVLKSASKPHYATDIAQFTGLPLARVERVLEHLEGRAKANPTGKIRVPWSRMAGQTADGGVATNDRDILIAAKQRHRSINSQARRHESRVEVEYRRKLADRELAIDWAKAGRMVGHDRFKEVRDEVNVLFLDALLAQGMPTLDAVKAHLELMSEIDAL